MIDRAYLTYAAQFIVKEFLGTFVEFPPHEAGQLQHRPGSGEDGTGDA